MIVIWIDERRINAVTWENSVILKKGIDIQGLDKFFVIKEFRTYGISKLVYNCGYIVSDFMWQGIDDTFIPNNLMDVDEIHSFVVEFNMTTVRRWRFIYILNERWSTNLILTNV
tara:strand:- start:349 stop:690 length:342 start_codon:yes stop_codon:yes gene_type:complete